MSRLKSYSKSLNDAKNTDKEGISNGAFDAQAHFLSPTDLCFYCREPLDDDLVYWHGTDENSTQIWMHPKCARSLGQYLIKDGFD